MLRQSLTLETKFVILVPKFLVEKKRKCNVMPSKASKGFRAVPFANFE